MGAGLGDKEGLSWQIDMLPFLFCASLSSLGMGEERNRGVSVQNNLAL
jgi:hypothetical protein